ncbi:hypothetical protein ACFVWR_09350 [Leifsonia sp. NPDC058292]|uniref:hypothetical protein n=1 Tax=Leifsonia sp. NPDC058292 TaxID=3346428 RepID=UPI0036DC27FD
MGRINAREAAEQSREIELARVVRAESAWHRSSPRVTASTVPDAGVTTARNAPESGSGTPTVAAERELQSAGR